MSTRQKAKAPEKPSRAAIPSAPLPPSAIPKYCEPNMKPLAVPSSSFGITLTARPSMATSEVAAQALWTMARSVRASTRVERSKNSMAAREAIIMSWHSTIQVPTRSVARRPDEIDQRGPGPFEGPGGVEGSREGADLGQAHALLAEERCQRDRGEAEGNALGEVEEREHPQATSPRIEGVESHRVGAL